MRELRREIGPGLVVEKPGAGIVSRKKSAPVRKLWCLETILKIFATREIFIGIEKGSHSI
jgi:hypothetical protein